MVSFPAIAEHDEHFVVQTPSGERHHRRLKGEALHPQRESLETLGQIRRTVGEYNFAGQYQQAPAPLGGGLVKAAWFKRYAPHELPEPFERIVQSWDTANKISELSDYSVCTTWGIQGRRLFLLHVLRKKMEYPELKRAVREQAQSWRAEVALIEDRASGTQLIQELLNEGLWAVTRAVPEGDKTMRLHAQTATIENGFVHLPEASWLAEYLHELTTFPYARHDDQADSTSQALAWFNQAPPEHAVIVYYRREEALRLHRQGFSPEVIAVRTRTSVEQVRQWLAEEQQRKAVAHQNYAGRCARICARCGENIPDNCSYTRTMNLYQHVNCPPKKT